MAARTRRGDRPGAPGGVARSPDVEWAGLAYAVGLDGWRFFDSTDPADLLLLKAATQAAAKQRKAQFRALAVEIVNALSQALKRK